MSTTFLRTKLYSNTKILFRYWNNTRFKCLTGDEVVAGNRNLNPNIKISICILKYKPANKKLHDTNNYPDTKIWTTL